MSQRIQPGSRWSSGGLSSLVLAAAVVAAHPALAVILIDDDFTAAEGYVDGPLQFQQPDGAGNGIWLGQLNPNTGSTPGVDSTGDGFVFVNGGPVASGGDAFLRNTWSLGATGGVLGGGSPETGAGFALGDKISVSVGFEFELPDGIANHDLFVSGVRDCFATCGFNATPTAGINLGMSSFQAGTLKVFTNMSRSFTTGTDNTYALFVAPEDIGINNGWNPDTQMKDLPTDLVSDKLLVTYTAELTDDTTDTWTALELVVTNVDTATEVARATIDNPVALETFVWNSTAVDDPFTPEVNEGGVAVSTGTEMWFASRWTDSSTAGAVNRFDSVRFEYLPAPGDPVDGDYNGDGFVDAADYTVWRDLSGMVGAGLAADGTGDDDLGVPDGDVDEFDYQFWANRYGSGAAAQGIPEPASAALALAGVLLCARSRRS